MVCRASVIVRAEHEGPWLIHLVNSLDAQTLDYEDFEVLFVLPSSDVRLKERLTELSARRPNVRLADQSDGAAVIEGAKGTWVLDLGSALHKRQPTLFPDALAQLADFGDTHNLDFVLGRTEIRGDWSVMDLFTADRPRLDAMPVLDNGPAAAVFTRRTPAHDGAVGVLGSYPCLLVAGESTPTSSPAPRLHEHEVSWNGTRLVLTARGESDRDGSVVFAARYVGTGTEHWLATTGSCDGGAFTASAEIDVRDAAVKSWLVDGRWQFCVGVHGDEPVWTSRTPLPAGKVASAFIDSVMFASTKVGNTVALDVGATQGAFVGKIPPAAVTITESARGTALTAVLDSIVTAGTGHVSGHLLLDGFPLRADIVSDGKRTTLQCYLSGLAGTSTLYTRFGSRNMDPTGLELVISPIGEMTVSRATVRPAQPKPAVPAQPKPAKKAAQRATREAPAAERARKRLPAALEPAAKALSRNPMARRVYQRLTGAKRSR